MVENENMMSQEDFDQLLQDNPPGTEPEVQDAPATESTEGEGAATSSTEPTEGNTQSTEGESNTTGDEGSKHSANQAFAQMRVYNKKLQDALAATLEKSGLDPNLANNPDQLIQEAENARLEKEAKKQNVPKDLLQRLSQLERANMENEKQRLAQAAFAGFQAVKDKYKLSDKDLSEFAQQLQDAKTNPFEQEMDLDRAYKMHNLDKIIKIESQKAVEEALRNQSAADKHSTVPNESQGKDFTGTEQIDTMAKFNRLIQSLK